MAFLRGNERGLKPYEQLRNSTSPLDELFGRALPDACDTSSCERGTCVVIQPEGAYACCSTFRAKSSCTAVCPAGYFDCTGAGSHGYCCARAASSGAVGSTPSPVLSTILPTPRIGVPVTSETGLVSFLPISMPEKSTTKVLLTATSVAGSSAAAGGSSTVVQEPSKTTLDTTTSNQILFVEPATVTIFTTGPNGVISSFPSISTPTFQSTSSATGVPNEGLISSKDGSGGLSSEGKIAIGVAIPVAFILAIIAFLFLWNRRRKNKKALVDEGTGVPELDSSAGLPGYSVYAKPDPVKPTIHELNPQPNAKEEYVVPSHNGASEMETAMVVTALRAQQLARNRSGAGMTDSPPTFEMPGADTRSPIGSELAADPDRYHPNRVGRSPTGYATYGQPSEMPYSPVYEADAYGAGQTNYPNQNEMPGSHVSRRSELMAGSSNPEFANRATSPPLKRKDVNSGPLVVPNELK